MKVTTLYSKVGKELGISRERVSMIYSAYWNFIREGIKFLDIHDGMTKEDFKKKKYGFRMSKVGVLYCDYRTYKSRNKKLLNTKRNAEHNKSEADVQCDSDNG